MPSAYFYHDGKQSRGPLTAAELVKTPGFDLATLVRPVGGNEAGAWKTAGSFLELASALLTPPPPAAPKTAGITLALPEPRRIDQEPAAPIAAPAAAAAPALRLAAPSEKLLLIVEDDDGVRGLIELGVTAQGFRAVTAFDGRDALDKLERSAPDLIITDLMMPGMGGYEFLRTLQAGAHREIPILIVTGSLLDASTISLIRREANVVEFITKPIRMPAFVAALHARLKTAPKS